MILKRLALIDGICLSFLSGTLFLHFFLPSFPPEAFFLSLSVLAVVAFGFRDDKAVLVVLLLTFFALTAVFRTSRTFKLFPSGEATVTGLVTESPVFRFSLDLREKFKSSLEMILPEPQNLLALGILLGSHGLSDREFIENLRITGTGHIVSVSGYNISILIIGLITLLSFGSTKLVFIPLLLIVFIFNLMVGFTPPVLRASFMGLFIFLARFLGRQASRFDALLVSASLIAFLDPRAITTVSFQLSFLSTIGILYLYPWLSTLLGRFPGLLREPLALTLSAQIAVLPLVIYNFGQISLISPLANLLVTWAVPPLMALSFLTGFLGIIFLPLGQFFGALDLVLLTYFVKVVEVLAKVPGAAIGID